MYKLWKSRNHLDFIRQYSTERDKWGKKGMTGNKSPELERTVECTECILDRWTSRMYRTFCSVTQYL